MDIERGNIEIIFTHIPYYKITENEVEKRKRHDAEYVNKDIYMYYAKNVFGNYSDNEIENIYNILQSEVEKEKVFGLISSFATQVLVYTGQEIQCKLEELLRWRETSFLLGQDIFTCAFLAKYDLKNHRNTDFFAWSPIISSDDSRLQGIIEQGVADNHFHLNGSTKVFELNWISLMNMIDGRKHDFNKIKKQMHVLYDNDILTEEEHKKWNLYECCQKAALCRVYLFAKVKGDEYIEKQAERIYRLVNKVGNISTFLAEIQDLINLAKTIYGTEVEHKIVLDYAFNKSMKLCNRNTRRILSGERNLLYNCYKYVINKKSDITFCNIFYCYIVLRTYFRGEFIQINKRVGFANFSDYQDRKELFIEGIKPYEKELLKLAVEDTLAKPYMKSLEARICPCVEPERLAGKIKVNSDRLNGLETDRFFYILHFVKSKDKQDYTWGIPRDYKMRCLVEQQAKSIATVLANYPDIASKIRGIDACSNEIGCRPEVFAQAYRYLSDRLYRKNNIFVESKLHLTYHVGEDFLDIVDGLRAIDEVMTFCELPRGSRIGHGLALGINPEKYYQYKKYTLVMDRQTLIDDIAWALCKASEFGITVDVKLKTQLEQKFYSELSSLYEHVQNDHGQIQLHDYYISWALRGNNPELSKQEENIFYSSEYDRYRKNKDVMKKFNSNRLARDLYKEYHYSEEVRRKGKELIIFKVADNYAELVRALQDKMINSLVEKGIGIETNPSSNYLIGTIQKYEEHPIIRFNGRGLYEMPINMSLSVSINTDDQGIFDTLLENEYALMEIALRKAKDEHGEPKYDIESIYRWLDYIRQLGLEQVFK